MTVHQVPFCRMVVPIALHELGHYEERRLIQEMSVVVGLAHFGMM